MSITEREKLVLNAIVNYYLNFGDTIGSRTLVKKYGIDLSSATIRNVMADLEDMGFIAKTHTSSGRIPTDKGYKYYLDELLKVEKLTKQERENIELAYENRVNELRYVITTYIFTSFKVDYLCRNRYGTSSNDRESKKNRVGPYR